MMIRSRPRGRGRHPRNVLYRDVVRDRTIRHSSWLAMIVRLPCATVVISHFPPSRRISPDSAPREGSTLPRDAEWPRAPWCRGWSPGLRLRSASRRVARLAASTARRGNAQKPIQNSETLTTLAAGPRRLDASRSPCASWRNDSCAKAGRWRQVRQQVSRHRRSRSSAEIARGLELIQHLRGVRS